MTKELTKITATNFNPKRSAGFPNGIKEFYLGRLIGTATGIKNALAQDGVTAMYGAKGVFGATFSPSVDDKGVVTEREDERSGVLFLHEAFMSPILDLLEDRVDADGVVTRKAATAVDIAYDVFVVPAGNPAGYTWSMRPLLEPAVSDPLAAIMARLPKFNATGAIAAPAEQAKLEDQSGKKK